MKKTLLFLLALGAGFYLYRQQQPTTAPSTEPDPTPITTESVQEEVNAQLIITASKDGQTAAELLENAAEIETKDYGEAGLFVTSIDGVISDNEHYWAFYVNDEYAQQGISQTVLESGDVVKFIYEEITQAEL
jgi:hypothetical protein